VIGLTTGIFGTAQISLAITAAEAKGQAKVVASPRVTVLNNRSAQIESGSQIPVVTTQAGGAGGGGASQGNLLTTTFVSVPLRLSVTPQITDAGTVLLRVTAENNSVNTSLANGLTGTPGIDTQRMSTEVLVPDGGTTVVGGAIQDSESNSSNRTPGLGSLPVIGNLFKRKTVSRQTNEILFFITPRIYRPDYMGNPTGSVVSPNGNRTTTILQPVPLGNPPSNSAPAGTQPNPQNPQAQPQNNQQQQQQAAPAGANPAPANTARPAGAPQP
jgi:type IV pilus assembly protein PilQ